VPYGAVLARLARGALAPEAVADVVSLGTHLAAEVHGNPGEHRVRAAVHEEHVVRVGDVQHLSHEVAGVRHASLDGASRVAVRVLDETHASVLKGREFGAEFREDARVDRGGTGAEVVLPFG